MIAKWLKKNKPKVYKLPKDKYEPSQRNEKVSSIVRDQYGNIIYQNQTRINLDLDTSRRNYGD